MHTNSFRAIVRTGTFLAIGAALPSANVWAQRYQQNNLVANASGRAHTTDANLVNAWGLARGSGGPWWVANNGTGTSTVYDGSGNPFPASGPLVVKVPGAPTGAAFNSSTDFKGAKFLFASEDGTISAWSSGTQASVVITTPNAVYKGLAIASSFGKNYLYATDFHNGRIDVFDTNFKPVVNNSDGDDDDSGAFRDNRRAHGFAPFNIQNIGGVLIVTYAQQDSAQHDDVAGPGLGFVSAFTPEGRLIRRFQQGPWLNAPWGVALAPNDFGSFSHKLLIGQFGSGQIAVYNLLTGAFEGLLQDANGNTLLIDGLWALAFGDGKTAGVADVLYFTAGPNDESNGLFGSLTPLASELTQGTSQ